MVSTSTVNLTGVTVLQVIPELNMGGSETTTVETTEAIIAAGGRALIASKGGRLEAVVSAAGCDLIQLPAASKNPLVMLLNIKRLIDIIRHEKVDIIHARSRAPAWSCLAAAHYTCIPYLATYHGRIHDRPWFKVFYNSVLTRGRVVIANSEFNAQRIAKVHHIPPSDIRVITPGIDINVWARAHSREEISCQRHDWGIHADQFVIICAARITPAKGQHVLIEALQRMHHVTKPLLVLAGPQQGSGEYYRELHHLVNRYALHQQVIFAGQVDNMPRAYAASDIAVAPSVLNEAFGRTMIEAQAAQLPVIASDQGGFCETIIADDTDIQRKTGWLLPPGDIDAYAALFDKILDLPAATLQKIGNNGRAHVARKYTCADMHMQTVQLYRQLAHSDI